MGLHVRMSDLEPSVEAVARQRASTFVQSTDKYIVRLQSVISLLSKARDAAIQGRSSDARIHMTRADNLLSQAGDDFVRSQ